MAENLGRKFESMLLAKKHHMENLYGSSKFEILSFLLLGERSGARPHRLTTRSGRREGPVRSRDPATRGRGDCTTAHRRRLASRRDRGAWLSCTSFPPLPPRAVLPVSELGVRRWGRRRTALTAAGVQGGRSMSNSINMANMEAELRSVLQAVLMGVCQRCDFVHGEALRPSGNSCLVQSGASFCSTTGAADFHRASLNFYFPPNVSVAGRVWKSGCTEWHGSRHAHTHARKTHARSLALALDLAPASCTHALPALTRSPWVSQRTCRCCRPRLPCAWSQRCRPITEPQLKSKTEDVSVLPTTAFLRSELALQTELKAAFAVPLCKDARQQFLKVLYVVTFK